MGTPEFAVPCLDTLARGKHEIVAVVTQPDKPRGRRGKLTCPPVKQCAANYGIPVMQPSKIRTGEFAEALKKIKPHLIVTVAYGRILPPDILRIPPEECINVHASLLPKYRGAAPVNYAIINGEIKTGITTMYMDEGMDTGDIIMSREVIIPKDMTAGRLHDMLMEIAPDVLNETVDQIEKGTVSRTPQDEKLASYAPVMDRETGRIKWDSSNTEIHNLVRGTNPWPGGYTCYKTKRMKIWQTSLRKNPCCKNPPGTIINSGPHGIIVACGTGAVAIHRIQLENSRKMSVRECWHNIDEGEILG